MRIKVLLVDDSSYFLKAAERFLSGMSIVESIVTARSGADAVSAVIMERPNVVLMDLNMPGMSGFEAVRRIKALDSAIRVIVVSFHDSGDFRSAALQSGADGYIAKHNFATDLPAALAEYDEVVRPCAAS